VSAVTIRAASRLPPGLSPIRTIRLYSFGFPKTIWHGAPLGFRATAAAFLSFVRRRGAARARECGARSTSGPFVRHRSSSPALLGLGATFFADDQPLLAAALPFSQSLHLHGNGPLETEHGASCRFDSGAPAFFFDAPSKRTESRSRTASAPAVFTKERRAPRGRWAA